MPCNFLRWLAIKMERAWVKVAATKQTGHKDVLLWSDEDPAAFLPGLPVDECAIDFGVHTMRTWIQSVATDLQHNM